MFRAGTLFFLSLVAVQFPQPEQSLAAEPHQLSSYARQVHALDVILDDQVKDDCLPRPNAIKEAAESEVLRTDITIDQDSPYYIYVIALGYSLRDESGTDTNQCIVHVDTSIKMPIVILKPSFDESVNRDILFVEFSSRSTLLVGDKEKMQFNIRENVIESTTSLLLELLRAAGSS